MTTKYKINLEVEAYDGDTKAIFYTDALTQSVHVHNEDFAFHLRHQLYLHGQKLVREELESRIMDDKL
jgi:hypothetical protein